MRLVSYLELPVETSAPKVKLGALLGDDCVIDLAVAQTWAQGACGFHAKPLPRTMLELLRSWEDSIAHLRALLNVLPGKECLYLKGARRQPVARLRREVLLIAPLPTPLTLREFEGFEGHVRAMYGLRRRGIPEEWYEMPVFSYGNPFTVFGPDEVISPPHREASLDYELQVACVIGKQGRDIPPEEAEQYIAGYMILNNWATRDIQRLEMRLGIGPAKGKDFATTLGPAIVTPDELADRRIGEGADLRYDLAMVARVNGVERSTGNLRDIHWTFARMIAHASQGVMLHPGEVIASGTVEGGSLLEQGAGEKGEWLRPGDRVEMEVEGLGKLDTRIVEPA